MNWAQGFRSLLQGYHNAWWIENSGGGGGGRIRIINKWRKEGINIAQGVGAHANPTAKNTHTLAQQKSDRAVQKYMKQAMRKTTGAIILVLWEQVLKIKFFISIGTKA